MHKKILPVLLFLLATIGVAAQSFPSKKEVARDSLDSKRNDIAADINKAVFKKNELPVNQKVSPAIFYIVNDKPVSREEYVRQHHKINKN